VPDAAVPAVLIVEDDVALREALSTTLEGSGRYPVLAAASGPEALSILDRERVGLVVSDVQMEPMDGHELLSEMRRRHPALPAVLMTAYGTIEHAVTSIRQGASDYLAKPFEAGEFLELVERHMQCDTGGGPVACDPATLELLRIAERVAKTDATVTLSGESGCGKEVFARFIHERSPRRERPFVAINCAAIPENMLEAVLFGHEKGAFTGAVSAHAGKVEQAEGGTLLLDEVSEMDLGLQAKLLRVIQEREVERLGGRRTIPLDVRVLAHHLGVRLGPGEPGIVAQLENQFPPFGGEFSFPEERAQFRVEREGFPLIEDQINRTILRGCELMDFLRRPLRRGQGRQAGIETDLRFPGDHDRSGFPLFGKRQSGRFHFGRIVRRTVQETIPKRFETEGSHSQEEKKGGRSKITGEVFFVGPSGEPLPARD